MSSRSTVALVLVFAALAGLYWWTGRLAAETQRQVLEARRLFEAGEQEITAVGIERPGEGHLEAVRDESGWKITRPHAFIDANQTAWDRLAATVANLTNERPIESQLDDPTLYGLESPSLRVFAHHGQTLTQIDFGRLDPTQTYRYARSAGEGLFLAPAEAYEELNKSLLDLRDRRIFRAGDAGFSRIEYHAAANDARPEPVDIVFERQPDGGWLMTSPISAAASREKLDALASELQLLRGRRYIDQPENLADYGLAKPFATITGVTAAGESKTLNLGWIDDSQEDAGLFAQVDGEIPVFVVDASLVRLLPESVDGIREDRLFTREARQLTAFTYTDSERTMRFETGPAGGWQMTEPPVDDVDQLAVSAYISILKQLKAQSFPSPAIEPQPRIALNFEYANGLPPSEIAIGGPVPGSDPAEVYAWQDNGTLITLPAQAWPLIKGDPFKFRNRSLFEFDASDAEKVELTFEDSKYQFELDEGRWRVSEPAGYYFESQDDARALLEAMTNVKAVAVVSPHGGNEIHGLETPAVEARVWARDDAGSVASAGHVYVGNLATEQGRHRFARSAGREAIVLVDQSFVDDLRSALQGVVPR